ncbi:U32 family peptidase [Patescibacteria group bacterium]|nr:U32 family peptidase [Patescibacteria group bacterium]
MTKKNNQNELIAPAGSFEKLDCAIKYGADAVYAGIPDLSLRARINKFDQTQMLEAIDYVHQKNKKIYITTNIFAHNYHFDILQKHLMFFKKNPPDAFIASDVGVIQMIKKILPNVAIHLSTQANTTNWQTAKFWFEQGVKRIVLARELTLEEIQEIHRKVPKLELEYFVHGAMCMAYSGRCLLSSWVIGRSSNLGDCAQNCRWEYKLVEKKRNNEYIPVDQDSHGSYLLNSKDLCLIEHLDELKEAGITSFKIEGRAKSIYYLSQVVKSYRIALNIKPDNKAIVSWHATASKDTMDKKKKSVLKKLKGDLNKLVNRTYTTGFLFGKCREKGQETKFSHTEEEYMFVGEVMEYFKEKKLIKIRVHNSLLCGDKVEFIQPIGDNIFCKIKNIFDDKNLEKLKSAHGGQNRMVYLEITKIPEISSVMRKKIKKGDKG